GGNTLPAGGRAPGRGADWELFTASPPAGLGEPLTFGPPVRETTTIPYLDEITLGIDPSVPDPPTLAAFPVTDPESIVRAATTDRPLLVSGNGEALVDAAAVGLLRDVIAGDRAILYTAALADDPEGLRQALDDGAELLVSDSNRLRAERWTGIRENFGYVEQVGVEPLKKDPDDNRLPMFPEQTPANQTVAVLTAPGQSPRVAAVTASSYGNTFAYGPADRPVRGIDGDLTTAWRVGAFTDPAGESWQTTLARPTTADHVRLTQPLTGPRNRWITKATLTFDGGSPVTVDLTDVSRTEQGQVVTFPSRTFKTLTVHVDATNFGRQTSYDGLSAVGLAEVEVPEADGQPAIADDLLRMPTDLLAAAGEDSLDHPLALTMTRDRANPAEPFKEDTESTIARVFTLPTDRTFSLTGTARVSAYAADDVVDKLLGRPAGPPRALSSGRLPGDLGARSSVAFDGDPATAWSPGFGAQENGWLELTSLSPVTLSTATVTLVTDGRHSVPTRFGIEVDGQRVGAVDVPALTDTRGTPGATSSVTLSLPAATGHAVRLVVDAVRPVTTTDTISGATSTMPVGIAEVDLPGVSGIGATASTAQPPEQLSGECRYDLLTVDGQQVGVRVSGTTRDAAGRLGLDVRTCGTPVRLGAGDHVVRTANGALTGIDLDRLVFASDAGGITWPDATSVAALDTTREQRAADLARVGAANGNGATAPGGGTAQAGDTAQAGVPTLSVDVAAPTTFVINVTGAKPGTPFWLVLGQSLSPGWHATVDENTSLDEPQLVDGYANGWRIDPPRDNFKIQITWIPQRVVFAALTVSVVAVVLCLALLGVTGRRRRGTVIPRDLPRLDRPFAATPRLGLRQVVPLVVGALAVGAFIVSPVAGVITAAATLVAAVVPRGRVVLRVGSVAALAASVAYVVQVQVRYGLPVNGSWVAQFDRVAVVSWLAVLFLGADAALALLHGQAARRTAAQGDTVAQGDPTAPAPAGSRGRPPASG
ncbi:DUF7402 domain-containing protein, partial [Frankia nepalensis]